MVDSTTAKQPKMTIADITDVGRKITQWDENQSIDGIGEEDVAIEEGGVHDTEHCQKEHSPGKSSGKANSPLLLIIIHDKEAQSEEQGKNAIHLSRQQQCQHICHPIITPQRIRANALNFLPFNIYMFKPYLIDY